MSAWIRYIKKLLLLALLFPLRLLPVRKNRVLLINDLSYNYAGSPRAVADHLTAVFPNRFAVFFSVQDSRLHERLKASNITPIKVNTFRYFVCAMTAKVLLTNSGGFSYLPLRKSQYVINTWHGGGAYKKCGLHMYEDTPLFRKDLALSSTKTNLFLSSCTRFSEVFEEDMLIPRSVFWEIGLPRNDMIMHPDAASREEIRKQIGLSSDEKLILYAPTYRKVADNYFNDSIAIEYGIDPDRVCAAMEKRFGGKWRFAFRLHPCAVNRDEIPHHCMNLSYYEDMQDLLLAADAMVNDFSSSMWDFMLTGKPCFTFAVDLQHYIETTDVYTPVSEWPFPQATNNDELEKNILEFDEEKYAAACKRHYKALGGCETGEATKLVCDRIYEVCFGEKHKEGSVK